MKAKDGLYGVPVPNLFATDVNTSLSQIPACGVEKDKARIVLLQTRNINLPLGLKMSSLSR